MSLPDNSDNTPTVWDILTRMEVCSIVDLMRQATRKHWLQRAHDFEWALHRPGDYTGNLSADEISHQSAMIQAKADDCRQRADQAEFEDMHALVVAAMWDIVENEVDSNDQSRWDTRELNEGGTE